MEEGPVDTTMVLSIGGDDLLGLHVLATMEGVDPADAAGFHDVARYALHRGLVARFEAAGLSWPPTPDALKAAESLHSAEDEAQAADAGKRHAIRTALIVVAAVGFAIAFVGGYSANWSWTGFESNNQVWDWMHLVLLPAAFGTFPLWLRYSEHMTPRRKQTLVLAVVAFAAFVAAGYLAPLGWTGFKGQTLWNWLTLIVLPLAITTVRAWPTTSREVRPVHVIGATSLAIGWTVTLIGGYFGHWNWTGYPGNTLWDWLQLLLAPIAINTVVVPVLVRLVSGDVETRAATEQSHQARERALAAARERVVAATAHSEGSRPKETSQSDKRHS